MAIFPLYSEFKSNTLCQVLVLFKALLTFEVRSCAPLPLTMPKVCSSTTFQGLNLRSSNRSG